MQAIIVSGDAKEIAALALEMQERQRQFVKLFIDGKEFGEKVFQLCPAQLISEAVARGVQNQPLHESKSTVG